MQNEAYITIFNQFSAYINNNACFSGRTKFNYPKIIWYYLSYLESFGINNLNEAGLGIVIKFAKFRGDKEYANAYINLRLSALRAFYTWAHKNRMCNCNLILEYKKSKLNQSISLEKGEDDDKKPISILSPEEQNTLLNLTAENEFTAIRNKCIIELILASALSAAEIISLPLEALNLAHGYIEVVDTNRERRGELDLFVCAQSCKAWLKFRNDALTSKNNFPFLFFTKNFGQLTKRMLYKIVSQHMLKAGIIKKHFGANILRQTAICNMFRNQKTIEEVQLITGVQTLQRLEVYRSYVNILVDTNEVGLN